MSYTPLECYWIVDGVDFSIEVTDISLDGETIEFGQIELVDPDDPEEFDPDQIKAALLNDAGFWEYLEKKVADIAEEYRRETCNYYTPEEEREMELWKLRRTRY